MLRGCRMLLVGLVAVVLPLGCASLPNGLSLNGLSAGGGPQSGSTGMFVTDRPFSNDGIDESLVTMNRIEVRHAVALRPETSRDQSTRTARVAER